MIGWREIRAIRGSGVDAQVIVPVAFPQAIAQGAELPPIRRKTTNIASAGSVIKVRNVFPLGSAALASYARIRFTISNGVTTHSVFSYLPSFERPSAS